MSTVNDLVISMRLCRCMFPTDCPDCSQKLARCRQLLDEQNEGARRSTVSQLLTRHADKLSRCKECGCSDAYPCKRDGSECCWLDETETLCSACAPDEEE